MLKDLTIKEFLEQLASNEPVPGGGSVSALSSGLSVALVQMVANLTIDKKGYEDVNEEMKKLKAEVKPKINEFIDLIDKDANSFDAVIKAFKMPKETEVNKKVRKSAIQEGMKYAAEVPLEVAESTAKLFPLIEVVIKKGNKNAVTDGLVAAMMARTAIKSALYNVKINLKSIKEEVFVSDYSKKVEMLENTADSIVNKILKEASL
jgi:formiminotetrahydrofolate cyclodeaminase